MEEIFVAASEELAEGERRIIEHGPHQIGVIRAKGKLVAYRNVCPHQGGPVCEGLMVHKVEEIIDETKQYRGMRFDTDTLHVVCPWHGWEFNVSDGACAGDGRHKLKSYRVEEREGRIYVQV